MKITQSPSNAPETSDLALLIGNAVRQCDLDLLREVIREMAVTTPDLDARWAFRQVQYDFSPEQQTWFEQAIARIRSGAE